MMISRKNALSMIRRLAGFLKIFLRNKRGLIGLSIITVFAFVAIGAPLITPYDLLGEKTGHHFEPLSGGYAAPAWLKNIPTWLGGISSLSENIFIVDNPESPSSIEEGGEWNFTAEINGEVFSVEQNYIENYPYGSNGSLAIKFKRDAGTPVYGNVKAYLWKDVYFPYDGPPCSIKGFIAVLIKGLTENKIQVVKVDREVIGIADDVNTTFTTKNAPVMNGSETIRIGVKLVPREDYTINYDTGQINFDEPPPSPNRILAYYSYIRGEESSIIDEMLRMGDGNKTSFTLQNFPVKSDSEIIYFKKDGEIEIVENYTIDYATGNITFAEAPDPNTQIRASYIYYSPILQQWLRTPVTINVYLETPTGVRWKLWPPPSKTKSPLLPFWQEAIKVGITLPKGITVNMTIIDPATEEFSGEIYIDKPAAGMVSGWIIGSDSPTSLATSIPLIRDEFGRPIPRLEDQIFSTCPGHYKYGIEMIFMDEASPDKDTETVVYVDNFDLKLWGTSFGFLGTDKYGRDLFSQLVYGTRISLYVGLLAAFMGVAIGLIAGLVSGYLGGVADEVLMRFNDMMLVIPTLPLLIVLIHVLGARIENIILLIGFLGWQGFARVVRSQVLTLKERSFVEAAKAIGAGSRHVIFTHILPNVMSLAYVSLATSVPGIIVLEAALAWLGLGDPTRMSWGMMLHDAQLEAAVSVSMWWWTIPPGILIAALAVSFILLGYALDDVLNPRLRVRR